MVLIYIITKWKNIYFCLPVKEFLIATSNLCIKKVWKNAIVLAENKHLHYFHKIDLLQCFWFFLPSNLLVYSFINIFIPDSISKMLTRYTNYKLKNIEYILSAIM